MSQNVGDNDRHVQYETKEQGRVQAKLQLMILCRNREILKVCDDDGHEQFQVAAPAFLVGQNLATCPRRHTSKQRHTTRLVMDRQLVALTIAGSDPSGGAGIQAR